MPESFDLENVESFIKKIESEMFLLLQQITNGNLPDRATMVNRDYFKRLQQYDIVNNTDAGLGQSPSPIEDEPRNTVQFIQSILTHIPEDITERKRYLEKLLGYFGSISKNDKIVLIQSLLNEPAEKIHAAINEILQAFSWDAKSENKD